MASLAAAASSADGDLDEKSLLSFVDDRDSDGDDGGGDAKSARRSAASTADQDDDEWESGPHSSILHVTAAGARPATTRSSNYRAPLTAPAASSAAVLPVGALASRRLPEIALDVSAPSSPSSGSPSGGGGGRGTKGDAEVSLPSPSSSPDAKRKPFLMASLAIGLNEVIPTDDRDDGSRSGGGESADSALYVKHASSRSPKKYSLGLPAKASSPTHAAADASPSRHGVLSSNPPSPSHSSGSASGAGSKLVPLSFGGSGHSLLKFDPIVGSKSTTSGGGGSDADGAGARADSPSSYRRTTGASRSPLRASAVADGDVLAAPSKLDPLDTESIRASSLVATSLSPSAKAALPERKSFRLPTSAATTASTSSPTQEKASALSPHRASSTAGSQAGANPTSSPDKPAASPKFRNPFKKVPGIARAADKSTTAPQGDDDEQGIDLLDDSPLTNAGFGASAGAAPLAPMDELNYLSFSPRSTGGALLGSAKGSTARDLPSLSLAPESKEPASPKRGGKKPKDAKPAPLAK